MVPQQFQKYLEGALRGLFERETSCEHEHKTVPEHRLGVRSSSHYASYHWYAPSFLKGHDVVHRLKAITEEQHIFPVLAQKMPAFKKELELLTQHKQIHNGLDKFEAYIDDCKAGKRDMRMDELKDIMDSFGTVLWAHLQDEVDQLSVDNMRKYWSLDEVRRLPM